jgi:hypothetical protein
LLNSCDTAKEIGSDLFSVELGLNYTDTLSINSSTIQLDSTYTSGPSAFLFGSLTDPNIGQISSNFYTQISNVDTLNAKENSILGSAKMYLVYSSYRGDTTKLQTMKIYKLTDTLSRLVPYFSNSVKGYEAQPLKTVSFYPRPIKRFVADGDTILMDTLIIDLSKELGKELMSYSANAETKAGGSSFRKVFKGLYFENNSAPNGAVLSFISNSSRIDLRYTTPGDTNKYVVPFYFALSTYSQSEVLAKYNQFKADRSGSLLSNLKANGQQIDSKLSNNKTFVQNGLGLATKLKIPYLNKLKNNKYIAVNKAELIVEPSSDVPASLLLDKLSLTRGNPGANRPLRSVYGLSYFLSEGATGVNTVSYNSASKSYSFNITSLVQNILSGRELSDEILITPEISAISSSEYGFVGDQINYVALNSFKTKIKLYYSFINK